MFFLLEFWHALPNVLLVLSKICSFMLSFGMWYSVAYLSFFPNFVPSVTTPKRSASYCIPAAWKPKPRWLCFSCCRYTVSGVSFSALYQTWLGYWTFLLLQRHFGFFYFICNIGFFFDGWNETRIKFSLANMSVFTYFLHFSYPNGLCVVVFSQQKIYRECCFSGFSNWFRHVVTKLGSLEFLWFAVRFTIMKIRLKYGIRN